MALRLGQNGQGGADVFEVTGSLTLGGTLDTRVDRFASSNTQFLKETGFTPTLGDRFDLIKAGAIATVSDLSSRFAEAKGLFGYDAGGTVLKLSQTGTGLSLDTVARPTANVVDILAHTKTDADKLGMFFNTEYFGTKNYDVGMTLTSSDFITVDGQFTVSNG
ncbi:MAG: hypothetical protein ACK56I_24225, partial [bacterium]